MTFDAQPPSARDHLPPEPIAVSLEVIRAGQDSRGGYVACRTYPTYCYAWLRDGAFCAYAMGLYGRYGSVAAFHRFIAETVLRNSDLFDAAITAGAQAPRQAHMPPTRYTLTGDLEKLGREPWPNFQLDGYGTWLWALGQHIPNGHSLAGDERAAVELVAHYLRAVGTSSCYDCWEEYAQWRHTSTLAAVIAGLATAAELLDDPSMAGTAADIRALLLTEHVRAGSFTKHNGTDTVDASLLWLATPFNVVPAADPVMSRTVQRVTEELTGPTGGLRRYLGDTFYGGGEWILLTAWQGWHLAALGDLDGARRHLAWVEATATPDGYLPEQITTAPQAAEMVAPWVDRWGPVATPLLWSHAMHLVLAYHLNLASNTRHQASTGL
jgi:isomaltose glucohydrolase